MQKKISLAIIFGGKSAEHGVSVVSAQNIVKALNKEKYNITLIGIDKKGEWNYFSEKDFFSINEVKESNNNLKVYPSTKNNKFYLSIGNNETLIEVVFPVLHGTYGEDGTFQGFCKLFNVAFVGPDVLSSAICMDKDVSKRLLRDSNIPIANFLVFNNQERDIISFSEIKKALGLPFFIKPANLGSSVGISKIKTEKDFKVALEKAFLYDKKIVVEENIDGREIEISVLGNEKPTASLPGEIIANHDFYSYEAKYIDKNGSSLIAPVNLPQDLIEEIQSLAIKSFKTLSCEGMARVDFFLTKEQKVIVNEINTIPGFTSISMYPKLFEVSGLKYSDLIDKLIIFAIEKHKKDTLLKTIY